MMARGPLLFVFRAYALGFAAILGAVGYWTLYRGPELAANQHNRRYWQMVKGAQRGRILAAGREVLASSEPAGREGEARRRRTEYRRQYGAGDLFCHVVGYSDLKMGEAGLEMALSQELLNLGAPPPEPRNVEELLWFTLLPPRRQGNDVTLTIDGDVQRVAARSLGARRGAAVAIEVATGAVLALCDWPRYDPNSVVDQWDQLQEDEDKPLLPRAYQGLRAPGSVMKVFTAAAALQAGVVQPTTTFTCEGTKQYRHSLVRCMHHHGTLTLRDAVAKSCNIAMAEVALKLGARDFEATLAASQLGERPALFEPGRDAVGLVGRGRYPKGDKLTPQMLAACGYGQGELLVTPLWVAMLGQMIGNRGVMVEPHLVKQIDEPRGSTRYRFRAGASHTVVSATTASTVLGMMRAVMQPGGTAAHLGLRGVSVAGKTGSAQNPHGEPDSWFLALAPAEAPQVAVAVLVENGGYGGRAAGPVAMAVLQNALEKLR